MSDRSLDTQGFLIPPGEGLDGALGIVIESIEDGRATGSMPVENRIRQPYGVVHGGAHAALAETLASAGTYQGVYQNGEIALGMANQTQFMRSATAGTVHGEAVAIHRGSTTWIWDVTMRDDDGRVLAVSRMTIAVRPAAR